MSLDVFICYFEHMLTRPAYPRAEARAAQAPQQAARLAGSKTAASEDTPIPAEDQRNHASC